MAENKPIRINTSKYTTQGFVEIDGNVWKVVLSGAGTELRFSQASRACKLYGSRIDLYDKKIESGNITEEELDKYEEYVEKYESNERVIYNIFQNTFRDDTPDNSEVKKWVDETPTAIIMLAFEDVKDQAQNGNREEKTENSQS